MIVDTEDQIKLRGAARGLWTYWIWPALLRVEGSPERTTSYVSALLNASKDVPEPGIYGHPDNMAKLSAAALEISNGETP